MVVPGSGLIKQHAEAEGLDVIFKRAGFDWREAGCSMCLGMNPDQLAPGERCASTSNRNFEGRQGAGGRTHLLSPAMAAAAAITGTLTDVRKFMGTVGSANIAAASPLKTVNALNFLDDATDLLPLLDQRLGDGNASLPPAASPSAVEKFIVVKGIAAPLHIENVDHRHDYPKTVFEDSQTHWLGRCSLLYSSKGSTYWKETDFILNRAPYNKAKNPRLYRQKLRLRKLSRACPLEFVRTGHSLIL